MSIDSLHPPRTPKEGAGILALTLDVEFPQKSRHSATREVTFAPESLDAECLYQLARLLESEFQADRPVLVGCLRVVADRIEAIEARKAAMEVPKEPVHPLQQRLSRGKVIAPAGPSSPPVPDTLCPIKYLKEGTPEFTIGLNVAMFFPPDDGGIRQVETTTHFDAEWLDPECFYQIARLLQKRLLGECSSIIAALRSVAEALENPQEVQAQELSLLPRRTELLRLSGDK